MDRNGEAILTCRHDPGVYYVGGQTWQVGSRYTVIRVLGHGSFSCVCLANDNVRGGQVALKRIGNVLASMDNAKHVLREVCILRRLSHPGIIALHDVFTRPAATGACVFRNGRFVPTSIDIYLALEYCDQGDLFSMHGQLGSTEVVSMMWQLLGALKYLHDQNVMHRDLKTANVMMTLRGGVRMVKIGDLGSARSANSLEEEPEEPLPQNTPVCASCQQIMGLGHRSYSQCGIQVESSLASQLCSACAVADMDEDHEPEARPTDGAGHPLSHAALSAVRSQSANGQSSTLQTIYSAPFAPTDPRRPKLESEGGARHSGMKAPLTSLVCTPCYRAPEVVMSRGIYTPAIDMWSLGCIFGELLQRVAHIGTATTPHLQVAPVFAVHGVSLTPASGDRYEGDSGPVSTKRELAALFSVIGTPAWACIEMVQSKAWRKYLYHVPGRAPTLFRRFGAAGEVAVDLLSRLLEFHPSRRPSAEEAMTHEYFGIVHMSLARLSLSDPAVESREAAARVSLSRSSSFTLDSDKEQGPASEGLGEGTERRNGVSGLKVKVTDMDIDHIVRNHNAGMLSPTADGPDMKRVCRDDAANGQQYIQQELRQRFYEYTDPALALATLEVELADIGTLPAELAVARLREMLERECKEQEAAQMVAPLKTATPPPSLNTVLDMRPVTGGLKQHHLEPDPAQCNPDASAVARERIPYHADAKVASVEPEKHLYAGRHGEWAPNPLVTGPYSGLAWGVALMPPGHEGMTAQPDVIRAIRSQQCR